MTQQIVGVSQAAKALGLNKSTISRYLKDHPHLLRSDGRRPAVDLDELRAHRGATVNEAKSDNFAGGLRLSVDQPADHQSQAPAAPPQLSEFQQAKTAAMVLDARRKQLDFEREAGRLVWRDEVAAATQTIVEAFRQGLASRSLRLAQQLSTAADEAERVVMIEADDRLLLEELVRAFAALAQQAEADDAAA